MAIPTEVQQEVSEHAAPRAQHPLDPLYAPELEDAVRILGKEKYLGDGVRIASINLMEPARSLVEKHKPGTPFERKALAVLMDRGKRAALELLMLGVQRSEIGVWRGRRRDLGQDGFRILESGLLVKQSAKLSGIRASPAHEPC